MKKMFMFLGLLLIPIAVFCQQDSIPPIGGWGDIIFNFPQYIATFGGVTVLTALLAAIINGWLKFTQGFKKQLVAWAVAIILLVATDLLNIGYAKDLPILLAVIHGFAAGLASNGVFDVPFMKSMLDVIAGWFKPKPTP